MRQLHHLQNACSHADAHRDQRPADDHRTGRTASYHCSELVNREAHGGIWGLGIGYVFSDRGLGRYSTALKSWACSQRIAHRGWLENLEP